MHRLVVVEIIAVRLCVRVPVTVILAIAVQVRVLHELEANVDDVILIFLLVHEPHLAVHNPQGLVLAVLLQNQVPVVIV